MFEHHPLPEWAGEIDCANWAQFFLKFIVSHPAVTCAIPATSRVDHMAGEHGRALRPAAGPGDARAHDPPRREPLSAARPGASGPASPARCCPSPRTCCSRVSRTIARCGRCRSSPPGSRSPLALALRAVRHGDRAVGALLALAWLWVGIGYFILHFAAIDFSAPIYGAFFVLQALLLIWSGVIRNRLAFRFRADLFGWCGLALAFAAALAWPLADGLLGQGWPSVRVVGLAPGPTTVFTLGMLLLCDGRTPLHLAVIPLLWTLIAGAMAWILSIPQDLGLPVVGIGERLPERLE